MAAVAEVKLVAKRRGNARELINAQASKELIFAVVGPVGSGTTEVAKKLVQLAGSTLGTDQVAHIKASAVIASQAEQSTLDTTSKLERAQALQDLAGC